MSPQRERREPRIPPLDQLDDRQQAIVQKTVLDDGPPLNVFRTMVRNERLAKRVNVLAGAFLNSDHVAPRDRELVILRTAWRARCDYEFVHHLPLARTAGLTVPEIRRLRQDGLDGWATVDRIVITMADELCRSADVSDETWNGLCAGRTAEAVMELVVLAGFYRALAGFMNAVGVELEEETMRAP